MKYILEGTSTLTYDELDQRTNQLNAFLKESGLRNGNRIGIASTDERESVALILSFIRLGFPIAMIDPNARKTEAAELLRRLELKALFLDQEIIDNWSTAIAFKNSIPNVWPIARQKKKLLNRLLSRKDTAQSSSATYPDCLNGYDSNDALPSLQPSDQEALLLCTSGTTGLPKILKLSTANILAASKTTSKQLGLNQNTRLLNLLPLNHYDGIVSGLITAFYNSATQIRLGPFSVSLLPDIFDAIYKYRATHVLLTPSVLALMLRLGEEVDEVFRSHDFEFVISVAATLPSKIWAEFQEKTGKKVVNVYGLSETGNNLFAGPDDESYRIGSIGKPIDCKALIVNDAGEIAGDEEPGELLLQGSSITSGYLGESIVNVTISDQQWFATGDIARRDESGVYWLAGRKKNIIIVGGRNVYPDEINNALLSHPKVIEVATVGIPDEIWGERVVSCVVGRPGINSEELTDHAAKLLTDYKVPREIHILQELPKGRSGKVLVNELVSRLVEGSLKSTEKAQEKLEEKVLRLASESFRVPITELSLATTPQQCSRWDSVAHMDFVVNVEQAFQIELLPREVIRITSLETAVQIIREKLTNK
jgi:long-chain acyl-CoA synthetase